MGDGAAHSTRVSRHVNAPRSAVYWAPLDADAIARWCVPVGPVASGCGSRPVSDEEGAGPGPELAFAVELGV